MNDSSRCVGNELAHNLYSLALSAYMPTPGRTNTRKVGAGAYHNKYGDLWHKVAVIGMQAPWYKSALE